MTTPASEAASDPAAEAAAAASSAATAAAGNARGVLWMTGAALSFSVLVVSVRELSAHIPTFETLFFRSVFSVVVMLPWLWRVGLAGVRTERLGMHVLRSLSTFSAMSLWFYAVGIVPLADSVALQSTYPLFTIVFVMLVVGERPGIRRWIATLVGFGGMLVIVRPGFVEIGLPTMILLAAAVLYATSNTIVKLMAGTEPATRMVFIMNVALLLYSALPTAFQWVTPPLEAVPWILVLGLSGISAHLCLARSLIAGEASVVMPFDFLRLPFAALAGLLLFAEVPDTWTVVGGLIIFASTSYIAGREARARKR